MSTSELSKSSMTNDSRVSILKRNLTGAKKSKDCFKLPELQKYIETIIKASNEFKTENSTLPEIEKFPNGKQLQKHSVCKGLENKIKREKLKFDVISSRCKNKRLTSKKYSEAVSSDVEVFNKFVSEFEDPRNWKIQNLGSHSNIEKLIKKFYPNPYKLRCECQNAETHLIFEKVNKDDLEGDALHNVIISKVDAETQDNLDKTDTDLVSIDIQVMPNEREDITTPADMGLCIENLYQSHNNSESERKKEVSRNSQCSNTSKLNTIPEVVNKSFRIISDNSVSNISSRASSLESVNQELCKKSQRNTKDGDYDIGKLNLLNLSDSDDTASKKLPLGQKNFKIKNNIATDDFVNEISSEICNEISKTNDLNDLLQIYEVMNKATESFLYLTSLKKLELENKKLSRTWNNSSCKDPNLQNQKNSGSPKTKSIKENLKCSNENEQRRSVSITDCLAENIYDDDFNEMEKTAVDDITFQNILVDDSNNQEETQQLEEKKFNIKINLKAESDENKNVREQEEKIFKSLDFNSCEQREKNFGEEIFDANQKINEVLQFMNNCLLKFSNNEKLLYQEEKNFRDNSLEDIIEDIAEDTIEDAELPTSSNHQKFEMKSYDFKCGNSEASSSQKNLINSEEIQSVHPVLLEKTNTDQKLRISCRRKSEIFTPVSQVIEKKNNSVSQHSSITDNETGTTSNFDANFELHAESVVLSNENNIQVAESQNELGGYTEEVRCKAPVISNGKVRIIKSVLPLSKKVKRSQSETYKSLKDALEIEEKLMAANYEINKPGPKGLVPYNSDNRFFLQPKTNSSCSPLYWFEHANSNLVICVNLPSRNLRLATIIVPPFTVPKPVSFSLTDLRSFHFKPLLYTTKDYCLEKLSLPPCAELRVLKLMYTFEVHLLWTINRAWIGYYKWMVCFTRFISFPKIQNEFSLEYLKRRIKEKFFKNSSVVLLSTPSPSGFCIKNSVTFTTSKSNAVKTSESEADLNLNTNDKPVEGLIKAIQETENVFLLQQINNSGNNLLENFESFCDCKSKDTLKHEAFDNEGEKQTNKRKVQDLLLRTYKLQKKLQQYLYNISQANITQTENLSHSLINQNLDVTETKKKDSLDVSLTDVNIKPDKLPPLVQGSVQPLLTDENPKTDEAVIVNVEMIDRGTVYSPPSEEDSQTLSEKLNKSDYKEKNFSYLENEEQNCLNLENDEDDRSSTYSFKSSNDFSEINESQDPIQESSNVANKRDVIKKIFNEIESLKQSVDAENVGKQEQKSCNQINNSDLKKEDEAVEFDPKNPAKVLKTVFKGKKSSTELTIGLKDVPMTKVNNISVEKTKFSPNHTKISICISKEKPIEMKSSDKLGDKTLTNKVSSYFFDHMRPCLNTCQTEYCKVEDDVSKSSLSLNEGSDLDEDDFKSVKSTLANSSMVENHKELISKNQVVVKMCPSKSFTKHKFDFYRKMDMNVEGIKINRRPFTNSCLRFKELEPLKEALTELQVRMRSIKRDAILNSNDYYERALKLAKMSAGYCQSCGTRTVIPDDTFGYYKTLLPRRQTHHRRSRHFKTTLTPNSSFYSFQSSNAKIGDFCDFDTKGSSSFLLNRSTHSNKTVLRSSLQDMPILLEKM